MQTDAPLDRLGQSIMGSFYSHCAKKYTIIEGRERKKRDKRKRVIYLNNVKFLYSFTICFVAMDI